MVNPRATYRLAGLMLGCLLLAIVLPFAADKNEPVHLVETSPSAIRFTPAGTNKNSDVPIGAQVQNAGTIELGLFAALRLDKYSAVTLSDVTFNAKTRTVKSAKILVKTGRVWLANHVAGSRINLADERVMVKSEGGSLLFDKTPPNAASESFTRISAVTNPATISFIAPGETKIFYETALSPGKSVSLSPELITSLLNASDRITRATVWQNKLEPAEKFIDAFYTDNKTLDAFTISRLIDDLQATLAQHKPSLFANVREMLTFLPAAKARYWRDHAGSTLLTALENPGSVDWQRIGKSVLPYPSAREVFATLVPYTRLIPSSALPQKTKVALDVLSSLDNALSSAGGVELTPISSAALREIAFTNSAAETETNFRQKHLENFATLVPQLPAESIELCAAGVTTELVKNGSATLADVYTLLSTHDTTALTNLLTNSLVIADSLVEDTRTETAKIVVAKIKDDLSLAAGALPASEPLTNLQQRVGMIEKKITYIGTLHGSATFDTESYEKWSLENGADSTSLTTDPVTDSPEPTAIAPEPSIPTNNDTIDRSVIEPTSTAESTPSTSTETTTTAPEKPTLVERPRPALDKIFELLKADAITGASK